MTAQHPLLPRDVKVTTTMVAGPGSAEFVRRRARPVLWFAVAGGAFLAFAIYLYVAWVFSGQFERLDTGVTPVPTGMVVAVRVLEIGTLAGALIMGYFVVVRPWRRDRRLSFDGTLYLAFACLFWQDPLYSYTRPVHTFNSAFVTFGSWLGEVPGVMTPNAHRIGEPALFILPCYPVMLLGPILVANAIMRRAEHRWPRLGRAGIVGICFVCLAQFDFLIEGLLLGRTGVMSFPGAIQSWTIFRGKYYQFPLYEPLLWGACWTALASLRYFRDDQGHTVIERGLERVHVGTRAKSGIRFLALFGALNLIVLVTFNVPQQWITLHGDPWPADIQKRSYLVNGICGAGTGYACGGKEVPIPFPTSAHIDPNGQLVVPEGTNLPPPVDVMR